MERQHLRLNAGTRVLDPVIAIEGNSNVNQSPDRPIPPGWYADQRGVIRWWDGARWSHHTRPGVEGPIPTEDGGVEDDGTTRVSDRRRYPVRPGGPVRRREVRPPRPATRPAAPAPASAPPAPAVPVSAPARVPGRPAQAWSAPPSAPFQPPSAHPRVAAAARPSVAEQTAVVLPGFGPGTQGFSPSFEEAQRRHRRLVVVACLGALLFAILGIGVVAFSGALADTPAETAPTRAEFCADYTRFTGADSTLDAKGVVAGMRPAEDMTTAQQEGFEVFADHVASTPDDGELVGLSTAIVAPEDLDAVTSYFGYVETNCL
ncbi:DUF2510 domain-containing protein [Nocardioides insulae]|uniref:DUF2510 domain-containing protein n=1 Tax=Nocardioides insulae TaxID=394734 RepID=UPI00049074EB|nr:DUF2510 domain-containing protein [Nocardioides insulae]